MCATACLLALAAALAAQEPAPAQDPAPGQESVLAQESVPAQETVPVQEPAPAREPAPAGRPRVGLVLTGGGAQALAQIGVLQALEEHRIPVDFVVGSGVGSLIGGLYASGLSGAEIEAQVATPLLLDALEGRISRQLLSWRQRVKDRDFLVDLPIAFGPSGVGLTRGLVRTRWLSWRLSALTLESSTARDFDGLPIPFRAVATDLLSGERVVLATGDLPTAMLASMSDPGLYAPVLSGGRQLASGALVDSAPASIAIEAGCDVVLLVDCTHLLAEPARLHSFLSAMRHVQVFSGERARQRELARLRPDDLHIVPLAPPELEDDYRGVRSLIAAGREAIECCTDGIDALALDPEAWEHHLAERHARRPALPRLSSIEVYDESGLEPHVLLDRFESRAGQPLDAPTLSEDLLRLYGLDYHDRIDLSLGTRPDGTADLYVRTHAGEETLWDPRIGATLEGVLGKDATFSLGAAFTLRPLNSLGAEWRNRIEAGTNLNVFSEFWQPIDRAARWFVAPSAGLALEQVNLADGENVLARYDVFEVAARFDVGRVLGEWGELRAGIYEEWVQADLAIGDPATLASTEFTQGLLLARFTADTFDSLSFPRAGTLALVEAATSAEFLPGEEQSWLTMRADHAVSSGAAALVLGAEFDSALDDEDVLQSYFPLGGFLRLSGLGRDSVAGAHALLARAVGTVELGRPDLHKPFVHWYAGMSLEAGNVWLDRDDIAFEDLRWGGSAFLAVDTLLGPVFLGYGLTEPGESAVFITFGKVYSLPALP